MRKLKEILLLHVIFPLADIVMGTCAMKWYKQIQVMNTWTAKQVADWQQQHLQDFIRHAYEHTVYYRRIFDERGLTPADIQTPADLAKLPIITKDIIREHYDELVPDNIATISHRKERSGGTTGVPLQYLCDENTWGYVTAIRIYAWQTMGYHFGDAFVAFGSASLFSKKPSLVRRIYDIMRSEYALNSVNLTDEKCQQYVDFIKRKHIRFIYGYAASIYVLTQYVAKHHIDLTQVQAVFTTSEKLTEENRLLIANTYQCKVMDCYGAKDAGITAYEIKYKHHYDVGYNLIAEVINPIAPNEGTLLTTNFMNYAFPMIRYQVGDEVQILPQEQVLKYNGQQLGKILGRTADVMRLANGHNLTSTGFAMIMKEFDIHAFRVDKTDDLQVTLKIQPTDQYTPAQEQLIRKTIMNYIGTECELVITYVEQFEPLSNGKRGYFLNK